MASTKHRERAKRTPGGHGRVRSDFTFVARPTLTPAHAREFVKLLHAGVPALTCLTYLDPTAYAGLDEDQRDAWLTAWTADRLVLDATRELNGGEWQALDPDRRLDIALDKHYAELAHFLYTHDFAASEGSELKKIELARTAIMEKLHASSEGEDTPFTRMMRDLIEGRLRDGDLGPPIATVTQDAISTEQATARSKRKKES